MGLHHAANASAAEEFSVSEDLTAPAASSVIQPRSPTGKALIEADHAASSCSNRWSSARFVGHTPVTPALPVVAPVVHDNAI
jgi:hypothetical protein